MISAKKKADIRRKKIANELKSYLTAAETSRNEKKQENLRLKKRSLVGGRREVTQIQIRSRIFYAPRSSIKTEHINGLSTKNEVQTTIFMMCPPSVSP